MSEIDQNHEKHTALKEVIKLESLARMPLFLPVVC